MADKDFKVKNKLFVNGLSHNSGVILATNNNLDSSTTLPTQYGGTGTTTSPNAGQVLYSSAGTNYSPTTLLDIVTVPKYQASAPSSPVVGQIWIDSDEDVTSFDPNLTKRQVFTATAGQTNFVTSISFIEGYEQVYFNGLLLLRTTDYTTSGGNTVILASAAAANDIVEVLTVTNLSTINTYTQPEIDTALALKLSTSTAASTYLTQSNAASTYLTQSNAASTYLTQSSASSTYLTQSNASSTYAAKSNPTFTAIGGDEGGQINLGTAATNTTLTGPISLDIYQNRLRIFEGGGNNRGAYIDLSTLSNGVGSELLAAAPQSGNSGKYLTTNGTTASWATVASTTFPAFRAYGQNQQGFSANTWTKVTYDVEVFDTDNKYSNGRFTPGVAGYYYVSARMQAASGNNNSCFVAIYKNGVNNTQDSTESNPYASGNPNAVIYLSATDYVEVYAYLNASIGNSNGDNILYFSAVGIRS